MPLKQIKYDNNREKWQGEFFWPQLHERYLVPINAANHPEYRGMTGICIGRRYNGYGMSWALIDFDVPDEAKNPDWIRTTHLIPLNIR